VAKEAVITIVKSGLDILVVKKIDDGGQSLMSDQWHLPGETKQAGESNEETVVRGIREETRILVTAIRFLTNSITPKETLLYWYECEALSRDVVPGDDAVDAKFVPKTEVSSVCSTYSVEMWPEFIKQYFGLVD